MPWFVTFFYMCSVARFGFTSFSGRVKKITATIMKADKKTILLGFAILSEEEIEEAVRLLKKAWFD